MNKEKLLAQEGIVAHRENSGKPRFCPSCHSKLRINVKNLKVYCATCGHVEPCHLRSLTIDQVNCSSCPYSPLYDETLALKAHKHQLLKAMRKGIAHRPKQLTLGAVVSLTQQNLVYPKLKGKCCQSWTPMINEGRVHQN